ncbi:MarR family transcriptional regulator [Methylomonas methanica]|uniref:Tetratricopeptide TPR_1 repeat-containing protein n=1 Tax=Methylomonas methanica (strain DSM 25384 / MC09) TaxID=857087 RepID=G0A605_METMM|nr:MarR family transcriptional regulator [Methylomonas methanica]AEG00455.1 Tetratricopeptide TPR_1 repeat-containing protein [Methylomonas methanica MC09]
MNDKTFLSVFTPSRTAPEDLEAIFVQRHAMLADAVERVKESATSGHKHHLLFVGPRGTGKSHLLTLLVHRVGLDSTLQQVLQIAWLNEDETSTSLLELLRRIYLALAKRYPGIYSEEDLEPIYELDADAAERLLARLLLEKLTGKTLLVALENLDALFEGLGKAGQQRLRAFIQEHPVLTIVATAQRLVDDVSKRNSTFFGFFQTEMLATLSVEEAAELLGKIAELNRQDKAAAFLRSSTGRSRVRALHHLSGGNHRVYLVLSQFITGDNIDALVDPFAKMVDEMTPYYQERIRWLPAQQRKIVEFLCSRERPTPVKEIARRLFTTQQSVSGQLKDLRDRGYVQAAQRGRESLYEIAEPLMRICVEVKENQSPGPMRLLVDFLRVWYDGDQLDERLSVCGESGQARNYLQAAIDRNSAFGNLRAQLLVEDFRYELNDEQRETWMPRIENVAEDSEELALAYGELAKGNYELGLKYLEEIFKEIDKYPVVVIDAAAATAAIQYFKLGHIELSIDALDTIAALPGLSNERLSVVLILRGYYHEKLGMAEKAIEDYSRVVNLNGIEPEQTAIALVQRGKIKGESGEIEEALKDFERVVELHGIPPEHTAKVHYNIGSALRVVGDLDGAIAAYTVAIEIPGISTEILANSLYSRGLVYSIKEKTENAECDFRAIISLTDAPQDLIVYSQLALTLGDFMDGRWQKGLQTLADALSGLATDIQPEEVLLNAIVTFMFVSSLAPAARKQCIAELAQVFEQHNASTFLGDTLVRHLGDIHRDSGEMPSPDSLEQWISAWEAAGQSTEALRLPLRILRTGIDFLKTGGQDLSILLDLNQEERQILLQAFGIEGC